MVLSKRSQKSGAGSPSGRNCKPAYLVAGALEVLGERPHEPLLAAFGFVGFADALDDHALGQRLLDGHLP